MPNMGCDCCPIQPISTPPHYCPSALALHEQTQTRHPHSRHRSFLLRCSPVSSLSSCCFLPTLAHVRTAAHLCWSHQCCHAPAPFCMPHLPCSVHLPLWRTIWRATRWQNQAKDCQNWATQASWSKYRSHNPTQPFCDPNLILLLFASPSRASTAVSTFN